MVVYDMPNEVVNKAQKVTNTLLLSPVIAGNKMANVMAEPVKPMIKQAEQFKEEFDTINKELRSTIIRIMFTTNHQNIVEALAADFVDTIPFVRDTTEAERLADARRIGDHAAIAAHGVDAIFGDMADIIPVAGEFVGSIIDALLPANTLLYLKRRGLIEWDPPFPPLPVLK